MKKTMQDTSCILVHIIVNLYIICFIFAYISFARTWSEDAVSCRALQLGQGALLRSLLKSRELTTGKS